MNPKRKKTLIRLALFVGGLLIGIIGMTTLLGSCVFSAPAYKGPTSDHFDGKRFANREYDFDKRTKGFFHWIFNRDRGPWPEWIESDPGQPPPERVGAGDLRVTFVNHSTLLIQMDSLNILTDPIWSERCSPVEWAGPKRVRAPGIRFEDLPPIDVVLLTHNHYDHLDIATLRQLSREHQPRILCPLGNKALLDRKGIPGATDIDWNDEVALSDDVRTTLVPCQHWSGRGTRDRMKTLWGAYVLSGPAGNVYFAGDTGFAGHFAEATEEFGPFRLAALPIGAYLPRWFMAPAHLSPAEAVEAHRVLGAAHSIPVHYGTFRIADDAYDQPLRELRRAMAEANITEQEFWVLEFGEGRDVPPLPPAEHSTTSSPE